jgi:hypothetical protein
MRCLREPPVTTRHFPAQYCKPLQYRSDGGVAIIGAASYGGSRPHAARATRDLVRSITPVYESGVAAPASARLSRKPAAESRFANHRPSGRTDVSAAAGRLDRRARGPRRRGRVAGRGRMLLLGWLQTASGGSSCVRPAQPRALNRGVRRAALRARAAVRLGARSARRARGRSSRWPSTVAARRGAVTCSACRPNHTVIPWADADISASRSHAWSMSLRAAASRARNAAVAADPSARGRADAGPSGDGGALAPHAELFRRAGLQRTLWDTRATVPMPSGWVLRASSTSGAQLRLR